MWYDCNPPLDVDLLDAHPMRLEQNRIRCEHNQFDSVFSASLKGPYNMTTLRVIQCDVHVYWVSERGFRNLLVTLDVKNNGQHKMEKQGRFEMTCQIHALTS